MALGRPNGGHGTLLMTKSRKQELLEKADEERRKSRDWLLKFMRGNQPKFLTKAELCEAAMRELKVSRQSVERPSRAVGQVRRQSAMAPCTRP
jgi:hypothetical protein